MVGDILSNILFCSTMLTVSVDIRTAKISLVLNMTSNIHDLNGPPFFFYLGFLLRTFTNHRTA